MDVELSIDDQDLWERRRQRLEALIAPDPSWQQHDPAQPDEIVDPRLFSAAKKWDVDMFIEALENHCVRKRVLLRIVLGLRSPSNNTLLHAAAESDDNVRAIIDFVTEHLISCKNSREETPLHIAARAGKTGAVELLLPHGNPRCTDHSGNSALHEAVRNRRHEVIRRLVSADPNPLYRRNKESKSPWCLAVEIGDLEVLRLLLEAPNDGEDQRRSENEGVFGISPVHLALMYGEKDMLDEMWQKKPWLFQLRDAGSGTPLHLAAYGGSLDGVQFLMELCPTSALEQDSTDGYLPIHAACMMDHVGIVEELLRQWPEDPAEFQTRLGQNILHVSARHGGISTVRYILNNPNFGHLINARDFDGNTPLHLAALHCQPTVVHLARDRRVDLELVNMNNMTAFDVAEQGFKELDAPFRKSVTRSILQSAGAPRNRESFICEPTGRSPLKRRERWKKGGLRDVADTRMVVAALTASVTFTSGFSVPGGYYDSGPDAGTPILLHKAMYNVFVVSNSLAMYSSMMAIVILLWTHVNDSYLMEYALWLSDFALLVTFAAMPLAFMAGVYVTVTKLSWLSHFVLVFGSCALHYILTNYFWLSHLLLGNRLPLACRHPVIRLYTDKKVIEFLQRTRRETAGSGTAETAATPVQGTRDNNLRRPLE